MNSSGVDKNMTDEAVNISNTELLSIIKHYYKCFGLQFIKWLNRAYPEIDISYHLDKYENDEDEYQQIYAVEDHYVKNGKEMKQCIKVVIQFSDIKPEPVTHETISRIESEEAKKAVMTFLNNSYMSIKYLIKYLEEQTGGEIFSSLLENAMYVYKKNTDLYLGYYVTFSDE